MRLIELPGRDIELLSNFKAEARERGKLVSKREGHNVFTITGRNWLSKLVSWSTFGSPDIPYTHRRVRWIGVGTGSQNEVTSVSALNTPAKVNSTDYLALLDSVEFPTATSVRFIKEFGASEISWAGAVSVTEAGLYVDTNPYDLGSGDGVEGSEDAQAAGVTTTLDHKVGTNPPIVYKTFEAIPKTVDYTLTVQWEFRF